ncbi:MAG: energy transducer TonB [Sphingomicrobium sp.]
MYRPASSPRERTATVTAVLLVHLALAYALLNLSGAVKLPGAIDLTKLIDIAAEPPPPIVQIEPQQPKPKKQQAPASAKNIKSQASPIAAPKPVIPLPSPNPIIATPTPRLGNEATQGASNVAGPGTGSGGSGNGDGGGGSGNGDGGGGSGVAERASLLSPSLRNRDFPPELRGRLQYGANPFVIFTVEANGRVYNCRIYRSSGDPDIDRATCALVTARFVYRPAINQRGQPVASQMAYEQRN